MFFDCFRRFFDVFLLFPLGTLWTRFSSSLSSTAKIFAVAMAAPSGSMVTTVPDCRWEL